MDGFLLGEDKGRKKFSALCAILKGKGKIQSYRFTKDIYCPVDAIVNIKGRQFAVEIKNVNYIMERYFIKKEKYNGIKKYCEQNQIKNAIYVVFVGQTVYIIDLFKITKIASDDIIYLQRTTVNGGEKIPTPVYRFPTKLMKKCKL